MSRPKPTVTADVPSGSIRPASRSEPPRREAAMATAALPPITTAMTVASTAKRSEVPTAASGSATGRLAGPRPGAAPRARHADEAEAVSAPQRAGDQAAEGDDDDRHQTGDGGGHEGALSRRPGRRGRPARAQAERHRLAGLDVAPPEHQAGHGDELQERERGGHAQLEGLGGEAPHLDLDRRVAGSAEDPDDAERGEREQERDRRRGQERGTEEGQRDPQHDLTGRGAERAGRLLHPRVQLSPQRPDGADDHGQVEVDVGDEDRPDGLVERGREQGEEGRTDHHRGQHEGHGDQRQHQAAPGEPVAGEHVGRAAGRWPA